jgi:hypothetical protein
MSIHSSWRNQGSKYEVSWTSSQLAHGPAVPTINQRSIHHTSTGIILYKRGWSMWSELEIALSFTTTKVWCTKQIHYLFDCSFAYRESFFLVLVFSRVDSGQHYTEAISNNLLFEMRPRAYDRSKGPVPFVYKTVCQSPLYLTDIGDLWASFKIVPVSQRHLANPRAVAHSTHQSQSSILR